MAKVISWSVSGIRDLWGAYDPAKGNAEYNTNEKWLKIYVGPKGLSVKFHRKGCSKKTIASVESKREITTQWLKDTKALFDREAVPKRSTDYTLYQAIQKYEEFQDLAENTLILRRKAESQFPSHWLDTKLHHLNPDEIVDWYYRRRKHNRAQAHLGASMCRTAYKIAKLPKPEELDGLYNKSGKRKNYVTPEKIGLWWRLLDQRPASLFPDKRVDSAARNNVLDAIQFIWATGLRRGNVFGLLWDWVDLDAMTIVYPRKATKGKRGLTLPLSPLAAKIIAKRPRNGRFVFSHEGAIAATLIRLSKLAGIHPAISPQDARRTLMKNCVKEDVAQVHVLLLILDHNDKSVTTQHYSQPDIRDARRAMEKYADYLLEKAYGAKKLKGEFTLEQANWILEGMDLERREAFKAAIGYNEAMLSKANREAA